MMKKALIFSVAIGSFFLFKWLVGTYLRAESAPDINSAEFRTSFVASSNESCIKTQTAAPENKDLKIADLRTYCGCMAEAQLREFTASDYATIHKAKAIPADLQVRINAMAPACIEATFK